MFFLRSKLSSLVVLGLFLGLLITAVNIWQLGQLQVYWRHSHNHKLTVKVCT